MHWSESWWKRTFSRYLTTVASIRGIAIVAGVGNEGSAQGHASGVIELENSVEKIELSIPREIKILT